MRVWETLWRDAKSAPFVRRDESATYRYDPGGTYPILRRSYEQTLAARLLLSTNLQSRKKYQFQAQKSTSDMHRIAKLLFSTTAALGGAYGVAVATKVAPTYRYKVTASSQNPKDFDTSYSVTKHGNPRGNVAFTHSVSVTLWIPERRHGREAGGATLTDEQMLVRMLKGYYGGWVIAPERWAFAAVGADIVDFEGMYVVN